MDNSSRNTIQNHLDNRVFHSKEIKVKHVYYVNFNPVESSEFKDNHLAVVLRKNKNNKNRGDETFIVIPLTKQLTKDNAGLEIKIDGLPQKIKGNKSIAIGNKIRSVNYCRFTYIINDNGELSKDIKVDDETFVNLINHGIAHLEHSLTIEEKIDLHKTKLDIFTKDHIRDLAFKIKKSKKENEEYESIENNIMDIIIDKNSDLLDIDKYNLSQEDIKSGIRDIIENVIKKIQKRLHVS
ncbi:type II toxin-antitoxin system PemK/MazF family toxin [Terrisporobacter petrolearius]|uniref:type II toxin-antitoxin system PemK/MazF family toxin n=1 Tax=Terrisporobacter petrolearius TaxID=1460447 RepID=UPI0031CCD6E2